MTTLIYWLALFGTTVLSGAWGGRYERFVALLLMAGMTATQLVYKSHADAPPVVPVVVIDLALLAAEVWLLRRHGPPWLWIQVALQLLVVAVDWAYAAHVGEWIGMWVFWPLQLALAYLQLIVLAGAVLRREFGPPYPPPRALSTEVEPGQATAATGVGGAATASAGLAAAGAASAHPSRRASR